MTIEEKITRYRSIPKRVAELQMDLAICTSVQAVRYDSIGEAKGTSGNATEQKLLNAVEIAAEIEQLEQERDQLKLGILQEINRAISGGGAKAWNKRDGRQTYRDYFEEHFPWDAFPDADARTLIDGVRVCDVFGGKHIAPDCTEICCDDHWGREML